MIKDVKQTYTTNVGTNLFQLMLELSKFSVMHGWVAESVLLMLIF